MMASPGERSDQQRNSMVIGMIRSMERVNGNYLPERGLEEIV